MFKTGCFEDIYMTNPKKGMATVYCFGHSYLEHSNLFPDIIGVFGFEFQIFLETLFEGEI